MYCVLLAYQDYSFLLSVIIFHLVGCWIMYKTRDNRMHELAAYNFMSADDPAKDPKDWYVFNLIWIQKLPPYRTSCWVLSHTHQY